MFQDLLNHIISEITGSKNFTITESEDEGGRVNMEVKAEPELMGIIIGKGGSTIKAITNILRVKGRIEDKFVNINVSEA